MKIPNTNLYLNIDKKIIYHKETNSKTIFNTTKDVIEIKLISGEIINKDIEWLMHLANLKLEYPNEIQHALRFLIFKEYKPHGVSKDYPFLCFLTKEIILNYNNKDYYLIARRPGYYISKDGDLLLKNNDKLQAINSITVETSDTENMYKLVQLYKQLYL